MFIKDDEEVERGQGDSGFTMPGVDFTEDATSVERILEVAGFQRSAMHVRMEGLVATPGPLADFLAKLQSNPWIRFG